MDRRLYLVDDEAPIRRSASLMLRLSGWEVTAFECGPSFLKAAPGLPPGCVLLDVRMPGMDGIEVQQEMKRRGLDLPVVMMTGHGDISLAVAALGAGAVEFVEKPFEKRRLLAALERAQLKLEAPDRYEDLRRHAARSVERLSDTERLVLQLLADGQSNHGVAETAGIPLSQVENCRASLIEKTGAAGLSDAISLAYRARIR